MVEASIFVGEEGFVGASGFSRVLCYLGLFGVYLKTSTLL